jgi:hypothetical protein
VGPGTKTMGFFCGGAVIDARMAANRGSYLETVAFSLWGLDAIKTIFFGGGFVLQVDTFTAERYSRYKYRVWAGCRRVVRCSGRQECLAATEQVARMLWELLGKGIP